MKREGMVKLTSSGGYLHSDCMFTTFISEKMRWIVSVIWRVVARF
jgi:hypothetical protein